MSFFSVKGQNALTENHTCQMEALIHSTTEAMKEMMTLVKSDNKNPTNANNGTNEKRTKWQEKTEQIQRHTCMQTLQQKTPKPTGKQMLGTQIQCKIPPNLVETYQKHLKVCRVSNRNRDVAARKSVE